MEKKISVKDLLMQAFLTGWELSDKSIAQDEYLQSAIQVIEVLQVEPENVYAEEGLGLTDGDEVDHLDDLLRADGQWLYYGVEAENFFLIQEYGTLKVSCTADGSIVAASDDTSRMPAAPSVPQAGDFTLTVTGESGTQQWDTLTEFEQSDAVFRMGTYAVSVAHGDPDAEGIDKPYYAAEKSVEVLPRRAATVEMTATIANSQTVVRATEQFLNYFHDAQFTVTTASGNQFDFTPGSTPADEPVFVKSATTLKVTGTARRQSQTGTDEGPKVTFSEQTLEATSPRTCHVLTFDAKDAGSVTLTVTLSDDYTETRPIDCEVNEGAIDDTK